MTFKKSDTKQSEEQILAAQEKADEALRNSNSPAAILELARKADSRDEVNDMMKTSVSAGEVDSLNVVLQAERAKEEVKTAKAKTISADEYERRTKLDVSDNNYINPDLDHPAKKK